MELNPLISIIVITYNSSRYVVETLESVKNQDYKNIELIITDDYSKDDTVGICKKWAAQNEDRFIRFQIITSEKNTGIPSNCNRGLAASNGKWIKYIAGDDSLKSHCIFSNYDYIRNNTAVGILQTQCDVYNDVLLPSNLIGVLPSLKKSNIFFQSQAKEQYRMLFKRNHIAAPSMFFKKDIILQVGGFDEDFKLFEDITMWLNLTNKGFKIHYLPISTVNYRVHEESISKMSKPYMSAYFAKELLRFRRKYSAEESHFLFRLKYTLRLKLIINLEILGFNKKSVISKYLYKMVNTLNK